MTNQQKKAYREANDRDEGICRICGKPAADIHHIVFRSHGGAHVPKNLICLCREHHKAAHDNEKHMRSLLIEMQEKWYGEKITVEELKK